MALNNNFYSEIFEKELYWTKLAEKNLLNIYSLDGKNGLKGFYENKKAQLEIEYNQSNNELQKQFLNIITNIIDQINLLVDDYRKGKNVDVKSLTKNFLSQQMNNNCDKVKQDSKEVLSGKNTLKTISDDNQSSQVRERVLNNLRDMYSSQKNEDDLYDDYEEEVKPIRK